MVYQIIFSVILTIVGFLCLLFPEAMLIIQDAVRTKGKKSYSDYAIGQMRGVGVVFIIVGIIVSIRAFS